MRGTKSPYIYWAWDCPSNMEYYPYMLMADIDARHRAGVPMPELSAKGVEALLYVKGIIDLHTEARRSV